MKRVTGRRVLGAGLLLTLLAAGMTGCAHPNQEQTSAAAAGAEMQKNGIMSQSDYIRIRELQHSVSQSHTISEGDLNWTLNLLKTASSPLARARAMTALSDIRPMSPAQKSLILPAVTPYLNSSDKLDQVYAERVRRAAQASGV